MEFGIATPWELRWLHQLSSQHFKRLPAIQSRVTAKVGTATPQLQAFSPSSQQPSHLQRATGHRKQLLYQDQSTQTHPNVLA